MPLRRRHRRWIAFIALFGLLFQQVAMATYACPLESDGVASIAATATMPSCTTPDTADQTRCQQHCHPLAQTADHSPALTVPPAMLPATTWLHGFSTALIDAPNFFACEIDARATAPPLSIQYCTFQI